MTLYFKDPKDITGKLIYDNTFSIVSECKNKYTQKMLAFLYSHDAVDEKEIRNIMPFTKS